MYLSKSEVHSISHVNLTSFLVPVTKFGEWLAMVRIGYSGFKPPGCSPGDLKAVTSPKRSIPTCAFRVGSFARLPSTALTVFMTMETPRRTPRDKCIFSSVENSNACPFMSRTHTFPLKHFERNDLWGLLMGAEEHPKHQ